MSEPAPFNGMSHQELADQYNPRLAVPDHESWKRQWALSSDLARSRHQGARDVAYGEEPLQRLDVFPASRPGSPVNVFTHGGFWRFLDKDDHTMIASPLLEAGATVVLLNYTLCPAVALPDQIDMLRSALVWVYRNICNYNGDPDAIHVSGHSAGAHLTAMLAADGWQATRGVPQDLVKSATLASGLFDVTPMRFIPGGEELKLTEETALSCSPLNNLPRPSLPLVIAVGADETREWIRQTEEFKKALRAQGNPLVELTEEHENHYSIFFSLSNARAPLARAMIAQMGLS